MTEIVINRCYGGFGLSAEAVRWMRARGSDRATAATLAGEPYPDGSGVKKMVCGLDCVSDLRLPGELFDDYAWRSDPLLVECVKTLGEEASDGLANLAVVDIPDGVEWTIDEYDGLESIEEAHRSWQ